MAPETTTRRLDPLNRDEEREEAAEAAEQFDVEYLRDACLAAAQPVLDSYFQIPREDRPPFEYDLNRLIEKALRDADPLSVIARWQAETLKKIGAGE